MFKSILNSIQKNVIGATIFGKSPTMSTSDEIIPAEPIPLIDVNDDPITLNSSTEETENTVDALADCEDPLCDPLALDDSSVSTELADVADKTLTSLKTASDGQIILIDVNILRNVEQNDEIDSRDIRTEDLIETIEEGVPSDGSDSGVASDGSIIESRPQIPSIVDKRSCLKRRSSDMILADNAKRVKRNIKFEGVNVFYFQRVQGNSCVPSQGGCTLGMARHHMYNRTFSSLSEHAAEQRRIHRLQDMNANNSSTDESDTEDEASENSGSDLDTETNGFLQPVPARQRRVMLKTAGVLKIDTNEKDECRKIRTSREMCGCSCSGYCDPDTCFCSQSGIQCQVDRPNFPCGCSRHGCDNVVGRVEFDPERVRIHFIHTILRLELENKQNRSEEIVFKNDVSRQWHPQTRPPDISAAGSISDFSNCNYSSVAFDNLSHRSSTSMAADRTMKDYDRTNQSMPSHSDTSNLIELANRPSDDDTLNLHYDYRNEEFSTESLINSNIVTDIVDKGGDIGTVNSFNSTFNEFLERTYNLGGTDHYQHHSAFLSSPHNGSTSSGIENIPYALCDETIPNSDTAIPSTSSQHFATKLDGGASLLHNDITEFRNSAANVTDSNEKEQLDDSITELLNHEIDVEEEIPSVMVTLESSKACGTVTDDDFSLCVTDDEECADTDDLNNL
ncbi:hypothetical protein HA402_002749 [Bradysia odoriphaga]|nr:hypothetical protein HA402_002749 [Bradysia odoriphaga]